MNGWANYETWNMALWISNDEGLYRIVKHYKFKSWTALRSYLSKIGYHATDDGVSIHSKKLKSRELTEMICEL
jgi:hypothetical protein